MSKNCVASWTDANTGRRVRQLTDFPDGVKLGYFRHPKLLPDGRLLAHTTTCPAEMILVDPESGEISRIKTTTESGEPFEMPGSTIHDSAVHVGGGKLRFFTHRGKRRDVWSLSLPEGVAKHHGKIPDDVKGTTWGYLPDGSGAIMYEMHDNWTAERLPHIADDREKLWAYLRRPRHSRIFVYEFATGKQRTIMTCDDAWPSHFEVSPADPNLLRYCHDRHDSECQRIWTVKLDGSAPPKKIYPQERGEMITHEFWWPGAQMIGYTYQDWRKIPMSERVPWSEYMKTPTRLGIANLAGKEVYLSDPLNTYHTHIYVSDDGKWVSGEGTDGNCFAHAGRFSFDDRKIDLKQLATIHTAYHAFTGQKVECNFSKDSKWLLFNDEINGKLQICAVATE